jgi:hypothetical protein
MEFSRAYTGASLIVNAATGEIELKVRTTVA